MSPDRPVSQYPHPLIEARPISRRRFLYGVSAAALAGAFTAACSGGDTSEAEPTSEVTTTPEATAEATAVSTAIDDRSDVVARPAAWTEATHGKDAEPNYDVVFPRDRVNQLTIRVTAEQWDDMLANMTTLYGQRGIGGGRGQLPGQLPGQPGAGGRFQVPDGDAPADGDQPADGVQPPGDLPQRQPGGGGGDLGSGENPDWVAATIEFDGLVWSSVGVRFKGNSSLRSAWNGGTDKLPLKFDFDEFEDDVPEIDNQRFYGFKQLSLSNNFSDATEGMRETIAYELLGAAGLPAARTASYEILLDRGDGPTSLGLYTVIEVPDDTGIERDFGSDDGNIYEGDGSAATLALGVRDEISSSFEKENNEDEADWSDVEALYDLLHSDQRQADPEAWRSDLEAIFDVDGFLEWLGLAAAIQHWDTYGAMSHNFFLYNDPATDRLVWISWDHNQVFAADAAGAGRGGPGRAVSLDRADVSEGWPLIRFLLDDPVYAQRYLDLLATTRDEVLVADRLEARVEQLRTLLAPYAEDTFDAATDSLLVAIRTQSDTLDAFLA